MKNDRVARLKDAIEGECGGLAITDCQASAILEHLAPSLPLQEPVAWIGQYEWIVLTEKRHGAMIYPDRTTPEQYARPLYAAPSLPAVLTDARLWSFLRSVMSHAASIEAEHMGHGYEVRSAHLDAAASDYVDKLRALATSATPVLP